MAHYFEIGRANGSKKFISLWKLAQRVLEPSHAQVQTWYFYAIN